MFNSCSMKSICVSEPLMVFYININSCTNCCINAINVAVNDFNSNGIFENIIVGIESNIAKDAYALKGRFLRNIILCEDVYGKFKSKYELPDLPMFLIFDSTGNVIFKQEDIQHNPIKYSDVSFIIKHRLILEESVDLIESDTNIISSIRDALIRDSSLSFIEPVQNREFEFSLSKGVFLNSSKYPSYLEYYFNNNSTNIKAWELLKKSNTRNISLLNRFLLNDSIRYIFKIIDKINQMPDDSAGKKQFIASYGYYLLQKNNERFEICGKLPKSKSILNERFYYLGGCNIVSEVYNFDCDLSNVDDTIAIIQNLNYCDTVVTPLLKSTDISIESPELFIDFMTSDTTGSFAFIDIESQLFILQNQDINIQIEPKLSLGDLFNNEKSGSKVYDIKLLNDEILVVLYNSGVYKYAIQKYSKDGSFKGEFSIYIPDDFLIESHLIDIIDNKIIVLNKKLNSRWSIDSFLIGQYPHD